MAIRRKRARINLALQGGGAHGAFTWGVLDRLLSIEDLEFDWISGTSAGAINAVAVAAGLAAKSRAAARQRLRDVWEGVQRAGVPDLVRLNPLLMGLTRATPIPNVSGLFSPYDFNPLGFDPLRTLLEKHITFADVRAASPVELLIAATDVATGRARLFRRADLTVEAVLASACLPTLHHGVEIEGRIYWDGGFSANPDLVTLATESPTGDTLLVQLNPNVDQSSLRSAAEITARINAITFNQPLLRDVAEIVAAQEGALGILAPRQGRISRIRDHRFHLIDAGRYTAGLSSDSKMKPDQGVATYLFSAGQAEAAKWYEKNRAAIGKRSTVDLKAHYLTPLPASPKSGRVAKATEAKARKA